MSLTQGLALGPGLVPLLAPEVDLVEPVWITPLLIAIASPPTVPPTTPTVSLNTQHRKRMILD